MRRAKPGQSASTASLGLLSEQVVHEGPTLEARLSILNRAQLQALVENLAAQQSNLVELIEDQLNLGGAAAAPSSSAKRSATRARWATAAAATALRRQMRSLLRSCDYLGEATYGVRELAEHARPHIDAGDAQSALAVLEAVTDEFVTGWTDLDDSDGDADALFGDLSALWAEAVLTANLTPAERQTWAGRLADATRQVDRYVSLLVRVDRLAEARRYGLEQLTQAHDALVVAQVLLEHGAIEDALEIAEHGLSLAGGLWSAPYDYAMVEHVADAVIQTHPDWVIRMGRQQAERIMDGGRARYYHRAVAWLRSEPSGCRRGRAE